MRVSQISEDEVLSGNSASSETNLQRQERVQQCLQELDMTLKNNKCVLQVVPQVSQDQVGFVLMPQISIQYIGNNSK